MGTTPSSVNTAANDVNSVIQTTIFTVALNAVEAAATTELPWLKLPIISWIFNYVLNKIATYIYTYLSQVATFEVIDLQTDSEQQAYKQATTQLQAAVAAGDANATAAAQAAFIQSLGSLIHFDGSSTS